VGLIQARKNIKFLLSCSIRNTCSSTGILLLSLPVTQNIVTKFYIKYLGKNGTQTKNPSAHVFKSVFKLVFELYAKTFIEIRVYHFKSFLTCRPIVVGRKQDVN
jgi:hypothetical protein